MPRLVDDIPEPLFKQIKSCQTAANEFLRHFWLSACPPTADGPTTLTLSTPAQRATKAAKMVEFLAKTYEKVEGLKLTAQQQGIDPARVQVVSSGSLSFVVRGICFSDD
jgi:transcription initiation factor TFIIH subunit 1